MEAEKSTLLYYGLKIVAQNVSEENDNYKTSQLPDLRLHVPTLWEDKLPDLGQIREAVKKMLGQ